MEDNFNKCDKKYALILAGGKGTRLWPISTNSKPKQFLNLYNANIMINETINRIKNIFEYKKIFIIVNKEHEELANKYIDYNIPRENIIIEPEAKNTAICIFYASIIIKQRLGNGILTILSSDHYIKENNLFEKTILKGIEIGRQGTDIVTIGIKPNYPSTGFGYIKFKNNINKNYYEVEEFKEKPDYENAIKYIESGYYYWNSGMFITEINNLFREFEKHLPMLYQNREKLENANIKIITKIYRNMQAISIDKGILEKTHNIKMLKGDFEWLDIGNLNDFFKIKEKDSKNNVKIGNSFISNTKNTNIYNEDKNKLIITLGIDNCNIINSNNVIFIANKDEMTTLKNVINKIEKDKEINKFL